MLVTTDFNMSVFISFSSSFSVSFRVSSPFYIAFSSLELFVPIEVSTCSSFGFILFICFTRSEITNLSVEVGDFLHFSSCSGMGSSAGFDYTTCTNVCYLRNN